MWSFGLKIQNSLSFGIETGKFYGQTPDFDKNSKNKQKGSWLIFLVLILKEINRTSLKLVCEYTNLANVGLQIMNFISNTITTLYAKGEHEEQF